MKSPLGLQGPLIHRDRPARLLRVIIPIALDDLEVALNQEPDPDPQEQAQDFRHPVFR